MKVMKKISAILLSLCLLVPCFSMVADAADGRISFTDPTTAVGEYVEVKCVVRSTSGNMGDIEVALTYDEEYLRFDSGDGITADGNGQITCAGDAGSAEVSFVAKFQALKEGSTKVEIAEAVAKLFGVEVAKVNTMNVRGRKRRMGRYVGTTAAWKKAVVTLKKDSKAIEFFDGLI